MRFAADSMLGRLARWLRMSGHDTLYMREVEDEAILEMAQAQGRTILTRDRHLLDRARRKGISAIFVAGNEIIGQLRQMMEEGVEISDDPSRSRCPACNGEIHVVDKAEVQDWVPPSVLEMNEMFWRCRACSKVYWEGGHWEDIRRKVASIRKDLKTS